MPSGFLIPVPFQFDTVDSYVVKENALTWEDRCTFIVAKISKADWNDYFVPIEPLVENKINLILPIRSNRNRKHKGSDRNDSGCDGSLYQPSAFHGYCLKSCPPYVCLCGIPRANLY